MLSLCLAHNRQLLKNSGKKVRREKEERKEEGREREGGRNEGRESVSMWGMGFGESGNGDLSLQNFSPDLNCQERPGQE